MYDHDIEDVMDDNNYATVLESLNILSLQVSHVYTKQLSGIDHLVLAKKWGVSPKKALKMIHCTTEHGVFTVLHLSLSRQFRTNDHQLWSRIPTHNMYSDTLLAPTVSRRGWLGHLLQG